MELIAQKKNGRFKRIARTLRILKDQQANDRGHEER